MFNPSTCSLVSRPLSEPLPQTKLKLISIDCRSSYLLFCIVFKVHRAPSHRAPFRTRSSRALVYLTTSPPPLSTPFFSFFYSFAFFLVYRIFPDLLFDFIAEHSGLLFSCLFVFCDLSHAYCFGHFPFCFICKNRPFSLTPGRFWHTISLTGTDAGKPKKEW